MNTVIYSVPTISCNHCVQTIQSELSELDGVKSVEANSNTKEVKIEFDEPASEKAIKELLSEINYPVKV